MALFQYRGRNQRGEAVTGQIDGASAEAIADQLFNSGVTPIHIEPAQAVTSLLSMQVRFGDGKVRLEELIFFCRQMFSLLKAGVPIMAALRGLQGTAKNPLLAKTIASLSESLDGGLDLAQALKRHPKVFPSMFVSLVQVGETTGNLEGAFEQLARYLEIEKDTRERIKSAVRYPIIVLVAIGVAIGVINIFVIPAFAKLYSSYHAQLPIPTRILIAVSQFTVHYWWVILLSVVVGAVAVRFYVHTTNGRYRWHKMKLDLPIIGSIIYRAMLGRFAHALSITAKAGVPLVQGFTVIARAVDNEYISARILQMRDGIERGETITRTAAATGMFPPLVLQMISVGEESGAIDDLMAEVGDYYEREVDYALKNLSAAIEPALIVGIGALVLVLALGVFLPMWNLANVALHH